MVLSQLKNELETLEELNFKQLNKDQRQMIRDNFNANLPFEYASDDWGEMSFLFAQSTLIKIWNII